MRKRGIFWKLTFLMISVVTISLIVTSIFMTKYIENRENEIIRQRIESTAKIVADSNLVKNTVDNKKQGESIVSYTNEIMKLTSVDFIVVMDKDFIRYSHPTENLIGKTFSNVDDARSTFTEGEHFSHERGTMGEGLRFFTVVYDENNNAIGLVCVGYTKKTVSAQILKTQLNLFYSLSIGLLAAIILGIIFSRWLKKVLLNLEPEEIARSVIEKELISDHITEGIIAVDTNKKIIVVNETVNKLLTKANVLIKLKIGDSLPEDIYDLLFKNTLEDSKIVSGEQVILNNTEFLLNRNPIYLENKLYGVVVTMRDQSEMQQLITELSGTEKYNDSLREKSHNFMNNLHVLQGLIELKLFSEVENYINYLKNDYHEKIGHVSDKIKVPSVVGLLLGKMREANENKILFIVDEESMIENYQGLDYLYNELIIVLGVLIDNAMEAVKTTDKKSVNIYLSLNIDERIVICSVEDSGVGIEKSEQSVIFERGYSTKGKNRGYGLEAVATIVSKYQGLIDIDSKVGKGTKITVEIPILEEKNENFNN